MTLSYEDIFSRFLGNVTDYDFLRFDVSDANILMAEKLRATLAKPYIRRLFSPIAIDDEIQKITFEMVCSVDEDSDKEFVIEILSKGMVVEWLEPQVNSKINIAQKFGKGDEKFYSQSQHLSTIEATLDRVKREVKYQIRDRGYINNDYLSGK